MPHMPHIFDTHTHFFSRAFYEYQAEQVPGGNVYELLEKMARHGIEIPDADPLKHRDRFITELDANGVTRAVVFASVPDEMEAVGEAARTSEGRLYPYAAVNPRAPETIEKLASLQDTYRFRGMLLFPAMHGYSIGDPVVNSALDLASDLKLVVFVHCGLLRVTIRAVLGLSPDFPLEYSHPKDLIPVAKSRPNLSFIIPHFGGGFFEEFLLVGKECPNAYADTAGSNTWGMFQFPELHLDDLYSDTVRIFGIERILFGSDTAGFPRGYRKDILEAQVRAMHDARIATDDQSLILGGNLSRLLEV